MSTNRLEAFSDAVLAIVITIMVLEIKIPEGEHFEDLNGMLPSLITYVLSFIYLGIYWNNHHHLMHAAKKVNGRILWMNLHLLFWLSLFPFATAYMGENHFQPIPTAFYGIVLLLASVSWSILLQTMKKCDDASSKLHTFYGNKRKPRISMALYCIGIVISFIQPVLAGLIYILVAFMWFIPNKHLEELDPT